MVWKCFHHLLFSALCLRVYWENSPHATVSISNIHCQCPRRANHIVFLFESSVINNSNLIFYWCFLPDGELLFKKSVSSKTGTFFDLVYCLWWEGHTSACGWSLACGYLYFISHIKSGVVRNGSPTVCLLFLCGNYSFMQRWERSLIFI